MVLLLYMNWKLENAAKQLRATSPGLDDIDNTILKNLPINYASYLLKLFNKSWFSESLPDSWKISLLVPVIKASKDETKINSYRPISMLSCIGKLLERIVCNRLSWYIERKQVLLPCQTGFRKGKSAYDSFTTLEDKIRESFLKIKLV